MNYSLADLDTLTIAGLLHDIGKCKIPQDLILKPSKLSRQEFEFIKMHPQFGYDILKGQNIDERIKNAALYHHERYDGKGYPKKLSGEDIPLYGRIIAVADAFDAMTANRVYREALDMDIVINELKKGRGTQFDPYLDDLFLQMIADGTIDPKKTIEKYHNKDLTDDLGW